MIALNREQIKALSIFSKNTDLASVNLEPHPQEAGTVRATIWNDDGKCVTVDLERSGRGVLQPSLL
jgi:hypothetical protein